MSIEYIANVIMFSNHKGIKYVIITRIFMCIKSTNIDCRLHFLGERGEDVGDCDEVISSHR